MKKEIEAIEKHLAALEFEVRRESGQDRDETADSIDRYRRKLDDLIVEVDPDITEEQAAWIAETERLTADLQRRIDAGEEIDMRGWLSDNWLNKVTPAG